MNRLTFREKHGQNNKMVETAKNDRKIINADQMVKIDNKNFKNDRRSGRRSDWRNDRIRPKCEKIGEIFDKKIAEMFHTYVLSL